MLKTCKIPGKAFRFQLVRFLFVIMTAVIVASCSILKKSEKKKPELSDKPQIEYLNGFMEAEKQKMLGNFGEAEDLLQKCLGINPASDATYYELSSILSFRNDLTGAQKYAEKAVSLNPENIWYQLMLVSLYRANGKSDKAVPILETLVKKYPDKDDLLYELADTYIDLIKPAKAILVYDKIEKISGISEPLILQKQKLYKAMGKSAKAVAEVEKLVKQYPDESRFYGILAESYTADKKYDKAIQMYNKLLEFDPHNGLAHLSLADFYRQTRDIDKWFSELKLAFASQDVEVDVKVNILSSLLLFAGSNQEISEKSYDLMNILLEAHPKDIKVHALYSDYLLKNNQIKEAADELRFIISQNKNNYQVWEQLFMVDLELNDYKALYDESKEALDYFPAQPSAFYYNGVASYFLKKYDESIATLKSGLDLVVDKKLLVQFYMNLGEAYNKVKNYKESDASFDKLLDIEPDNISVLNNYAYYLSLRKENLDKACKMAEKCIKAEPKSSSYLDTYAWVLFQMDNYEKARTYLEKALENNGSASAVIVEHYGDILYKLGQKEKALEEWNKATVLGEGSENLREKIKTGKLIE
ncbi:MAG: tetratricopeptide repeat protein [Bacteroidia bacterium]|nr:tetratricopeptide repeat protein [Bacteroidia bacterium]